MTIHIEISLNIGFRCVHVCHINGDSFAFRTTILSIIPWFYDINVIKLVQNSIDEWLSNYNNDKGEWRLQ